MKKRIKEKPTRKEIKQVLSAAQQTQIRVDTANQIMAAAAQVLVRDYGFTPDQCVAFSEKITEQIWANNQDDDETAVEGE